MVSIVAVLLGKGLTLNRIRPMLSRLRRSEWTFAVVCGTTVTLIERQVDVIQFFKHAEEPAILIERKDHIINDSDVVQ